MSRRLPDVNKVLSVLDRHHVDVIVIGGVAAILQGAPLVTFDLDIVHSRTEGNVERLVAALAELDAVYMEHGDWRPTPQAKLLMGRGHHLLETSEGRIDVLGVITGDRDYDALLPATDEIELDDVTARVANLEMLIRLKEETGRDKDRAVLPLLRATLEERRKQAIEEEGLDRGE
jgi:hypothetical protein